MLAHISIVLFLMGAISLLCIPWPWGLLFLLHSQEAVFFLLCVRLEWDLAPQPPTCWPSEALQSGSSAQHQSCLWQARMFKRDKTGQDILHVPAHLEIYGDTQKFTLDASGTLSAEV